MPTPFNFFGRRSFQKASVVQTPDTESQSASVKVPQTIRRLSSMVGLVSRDVSVGTASGKSIPKRSHSVTDRLKHHLAPNRPSQAQSPGGQDAMGAVPHVVVNMMGLKRPLPANATDPLMPLLHDRRSDTWAPAKVSVLMGVQAPYLLSSSLDLSGAYGKLRVGIDLFSGQEHYVKVVRLAAPHYQVPPRTRAGNAQTGFSGDVLRTMEEAETTHKFTDLAEFFYDDSRLYLVMEYGSTPLSARQAFGDTDEELRSTARMMAFQLFDAVQFLHEQGAVHNDIKHENVVFHRPSGRLRLIDFGQSESLDSRTMRSVAQYAKYGTYPPPERFGFDEQGRRASPYDDVWGVATMVLRTLSRFGYPPHDPFHYQIVHNEVEFADKLKSADAFERWFANMRSAATGELNTSLSNKALHYEKNKTVLALHLFTESAYRVDPSLVKHLLTHVFDRKVGRTQTARALASAMTRPTPTPDSPLIHLAGMERAHAVFLRELTIDPVGEASSLLRGLHSVLQDNDLRSTIVRTINGNGQQ